VITIRASAISDFLDCPARAEAKHLLGKRMPTSGAAQLGTAVHRSTAAFDGARLNGNPISVDEAAGAAVDAIRRPDNDVEWENESPDVAEKIAIAVHSRYCTTIAPSRVYAAVEAYCERLEISDLGIALTGSTDRVRRIGEGYGISDLKTGKTAVRADGHVETKGHAYQMGVYELLAEHAAGVPITEPAEIVAMQTGKTAVAQRVGTGSSAGAREVLLGEPEQPGILQTIAAMLTSGNFYGNPRSTLCNPKYCPIYQSCRYRK
jgi:hypothetical protein